MAVRSKAKLKKKPGEKKQPSKRLLKLPQFPDHREPEGLSPLAAFLGSCEGEVPILEAVREFQQYWCDHPRRQQSVLDNRGSMVEQDFNYDRLCKQCGKITTLQGRPPSWLARQ